MAGLYVHIPFCRQACRYCDFFFTVSLKYREPFIEALCREIGSRRNDLEGQMVQSIYIGGGTPTVLEGLQLSRIMKEIFSCYQIDPAAEITLEANPDDLSTGYLEQLISFGFNRLSIGIQSFRESDLTLMRRSHNAQQAERAVLDAQKAGFENISIDLIYGIPGLTNGAWEKNLRQAFQLPVNHISAYHLTYEPGTVFYHWLEKERIKEIPEQHSVDQYYMLRELAAEKGFEHYEISNFAKPGFRSRHNTNYWSGDPYLGFGPSAHSYNGKERRWNFSRLKTYLENVPEQVYFDSEILARNDKYNDYLITKLRTSEGLDLSWLSSEYGEENLKILLLKCNEFLKSGEIIRERETLKMTPEGWLRSDLILEKLIID